MLIDKRIFFLSLLLLCLAALLPAQSSAQSGTQSSGQEREEAVVVQVTGTVRLVGTGTFPQVVISGQGAQWYVAREEMNKLRDLQHRTVTVEAEETVREMTFANGRSAGIRRELRDITIINIEEYTSP